MINNHQFFLYHTWVENFQKKLKIDSGHFVSFRIFFGVIAFLSLRYLQLIFVRRREMLCLFK